MNSPRLTVAPRLKSSIVTARSIAAEGAVNVRFGPIAEIASPIDDFVGAG